MGELTKENIKESINGLRAKLKEEGYDLSDMYGDQMTRHISFNYLDEDDGKSDEMFKLFEKVDPTVRSFILGFLKTNNVAVDMREAMDGGLIGGLMSLLSVEDMIRTFNHMAFVGYLIGKHGVDWSPDPISDEAWLDYLERAMEVVFPSE